MKRFATLLILTGIVTATLATAALAETPPNDAVCTAMDSGKIDTTGDPASVTVTAPDGKLINGFCVKAGSAKQGDGPEYFNVDPPQKTVVITHTIGKAVSHYAVSYVDVPTTTTVPETTTTVPETTTTVPETTTTVPETTTTVPEVTTTVPETSTTVPETTTTVPETTTTVDPCNVDNPNWNEDTQTCELPFTGAGETMALIALVGGLLLVLGGATLFGLDRVKQLG